MIIYSWSVSCEVLIDIKNERLFPVEFNNKVKVWMDINGEIKYNSNNKLDSQDLKKLFDDYQIILMNKYLV